MAGDAGIAILGLALLLMLGKKKDGGSVDLSITYPDYVPTSYTEESVARRERVRAHPRYTHKVRTTPAQVMEMVTARHRRVRPIITQRLVSRGVSLEEAEHQIGTMELRSRLLFAKGPIIPSEM